MTKRRLRRIARVGDGDQSCSYYLEKRQKVYFFPQLGIAVEVVSVKGSRVALGVKAPPEIRVVRNELEIEENSSPVRSDFQSLEPKQREESQHQFRNRLNKATLGLLLAQKQLAAGRVELADKTLADALTRLAELESAVSMKAVGSHSQNSSPEKPHVLQRPKKRCPDVARDQNVAESPIDILLVEDDSNERALLCRILEMEGYRVHTAQDGLKALDCLKRITPRFVLLDMMMPQCDGSETFRRIRKMSAFDNLPIFAVSGASPDSMGLSIGKDGVEDWFPKPLNAVQLVERIRQRVRDLNDCVCTS